MEAATHKSEGLRNILTTLGILIAAPIVALALTAFVFQSYEVEGQSMETTLQTHDRLIILKVPRTISRLTGHAYIPHRGDVIVFATNKLQNSGEKQLIKRVVGLPGDRVVIKDGSITIYNNDHPDGFSPDLSSPYAQGVETLKYTSGSIDTTVPEGQVFVCGDNRGNSTDSRMIGTVPARDIVGKLVLRAFPLNKVKIF